MTVPLIMGDFHLKQNYHYMKNFLNSNSFNDLVKTNTCFKEAGSCIDLILTNRKYSFQHILSYKTSLSDHHLMINTML